MTGIMRKTSSYCSTMVLFFETTKIFLQEPRYYRYSLRKLLSTSDATSEP